MVSRAYRNYEEFEREELKRMERMDVSFEELLSEFDNDSKRLRSKYRREGLFDAYGESDEEYEE